MADPLNFRFMDARLKNGVYPFAFLFSSCRFPLFPLCLPTSFFCPFSTRSFLCISFLRDPALAPLPPLRLNNYPPFDDFALLLSYHILHMQIFIDQKNSEIKRFIRSLHVSPSFTIERERESIYHTNCQISQFLRSYLVIFKIIQLLSILYFSNLL